MTKRLVIDGDQMIFACGFASEDEPVSHAFHLVNQKIMRTIAHTDCEEYTVYIKGEGNFRDTLDPEYKANRTARKPKNYDDIVEFLVNVHDAQKVNDIEADDKVSLILWDDFVRASGDKRACNVVLSSPDKDLNNTPGWHYNPMKDKAPRWITLEEANQHFLYQCLRGDPVDNVKGLVEVPDWYKDYRGLRSKRVGPATAEKILSYGKTTPEKLALVLEAYTAAAGMNYALGIDDMLEQAQLLWMIREAEPLTGGPVMFDGAWESHFCEGWPFPDYEDQIAKNYTYLKRNAPTT